MTELKSINCQIAICRDGSLVVYDSDGRPVSAHATIEEMTGVLAERLEESLARSAKKPALSSEEWIPHTPGKCPVPGDTMIAAVRYRSGMESTDAPAIAWSWKERGKYTIVAYKVKQ